jgi:hypothetical protein
MKKTFFLFTSSIFFFVTSLQAYIILDSKTEVSPGCEGGVLSSRCTSSFIKDTDELNESNSFDDSSDELEEEPSDELD